jgi:transcriptional regulator GlxA family with amidase domain
MRPANRISSAISLSPWLPRHDYRSGPIPFLPTIRVRRAQQLLETTTLSIEQVATEVGFRSASVLREHFVECGNDAACLPARLRERGIR